MDKHSPEDGASADALSLAADEAEAQAAEAEAMAAAARAKAMAIRLRREAAENQVAENQGAETDVADDAEVPESAEPADWQSPELPAAPLGAPKPTGPGWPSVVAATLIVVLSLGLLGLGGQKLWQLHQVNVEQQQQQEAQHRKAEFAAAAAQGVVNMMSLDYRHAKADVQRIIDGTTGDFKKDFEATQGDFVKIAESSKSVTEATVTGTAVQAMTRDTATVLVAATTKVSNAASKDQQPRSWRWSVDVARDGGQIKLAKVEIVP
jgi:Mce-associated membrane protein